MKPYLILLFLLCASPAYAVCAMVNIIGDGSDASPYRPNLPPGITWNAHIPSNPDGTPKFADSVVCFPDSLPAQAAKRAISTQNAKDTIQARDPKIKDVNAVDKLPSPIIRGSLRDYWQRAYRFAQRHIGKAVAWAASAIDTFDRTDGALGANWASGYSGEGTATIVSNAAECAVTLRCVASYSAFVPGANQYAQGITLQYNSSGDSDTGVGVRLAAPATFTGYFARCGIVGANTTVIQKRIAGSGTNLATEAVTAWQTTDVVRLEASGTALTLKRNGVLLLSTTDSDIASGRGGILLASTTSEAGQEARLNDFETGDLGGVARVPRKPIVIQ